jgi:anti-sigma factor RsiW
MIRPNEIRPNEPHPTEDLNDYAFGELEADRRPRLEQHLNTCEECALELERLRVATAALRILPDVEIPQRIAFVSDKVFEPSPVSRFLGSFWNSAARLGFASACVIAAALMVSAWHRPTEVRTIVQTANANVDVSKEINAAVIKAVAQIKAEDARTIEAVNLKYQHEYQARMAGIEESYLMLQRRLGNSVLASNDPRGSGDGQ